MCGCDCHATRSAIMPDAPAAKTVAERLSQTAWNIVVIGDGLRAPLQCLTLLECVITITRPRYAVLVS